MASLLGVLFGSSMPEQLRRTIENRDILRCEMLIEAGADVNYRYLTEARKGKEAYYCRPLDFAGKNKNIRTLLRSYGAKTEEEFAAEAKDEAAEPLIKNPA